MGPPDYQPVGQPIRGHKHFVFVAGLEGPVPEIPGGMGAGAGENTLEDSIALLFTVSLNQRDHHSGGDGCWESRNGDISLAA